MKVAKIIIVTHHWATRVLPTTSNPPMFKKEALTLKIGDTFSLYRSYHYLISQNKDYKNPDSRFDPAYQFLVEQIHDDSVELTLRGGTPSKLNQVRRNFRIYVGQSLKRETPTRDAGVRWEVSLNKIVQES